MYIKDYIQATFEVLEGKQDVSITLSGLKKYLAKRGLSSLYPSILRGLLERMRRADTSTTPSVTLARNSDLKKHEKEIHESLEKIKAGKQHEVHIDEKIIGGFIIQIKDTRIDTSHKNTLLHAYRRLTAEDTN